MLSHRDYSFISANLAAPQNFYMNRIIMNTKVILTLLGFSTLISCRKPKEPSQPNIQKTDVYVAGVIYNSSTPTSACYWKNEQVTNLGISGIESFASDIAILNNDVYVVGYTTQTGSSTKRAALWKNGVLKYLTTTEGYANSATIHNSVVYVVGEMLDANGQYKAFLWNSGTDAVTNLSTSLSYANNIQYQSGEQLITGSINFQATVWKNGVASTINEPTYDPSVLIGIAVKGSSYYLLGSRSNNTNGSNENGYWIQTNNSNTFTGGSNFGLLGYANLISIKGDTLLLAGQTNSGGINAGLTKINISSNTFSTIRLTTEYSQSNDLLVDGNDIYVTIPENSSGKAFYWKTGSIKALPAPSGFTYAEPYGIFVHKY